MIRNLALALLVLLAAWSTSARPASDWLEQIGELHWHPATATEARLRSLALAAWWTDDEFTLAGWQSQVDSRLLALQRLDEQLPAEWVAGADGLFAWLVHGREQNLPAVRLSPPLPRLEQLDTLLASDEPAGRLGRLQLSAALQGPALWQQFDRRLAAEADAEGGQQARAALAQFWQPLLLLLEQAGDDTETLDLARAQAGRAADWLAQNDAPARERVLAALLLDEADTLWRDGQVLRPIWLLLEGLLRLTASDDFTALAVAYQDRLVEMAELEAARLRQVDIDLPVVLALMEDAAGFLAVDDPGRVAAIAELTDAYARLALFISDAAFYLDQPVREDIRDAIQQCNVDPLLVGPLPREAFEACLGGLFDLIGERLAREELVGDGDGPFASEFLRRELSLVSWQRARYLDGHLDWRLGEACPASDWLNVLDWSLLLHYLAGWVPQRPVFFAAERWRDAVAAVVADIDGRRDSRLTWMDCTTGLGAERREPVRRLIDLMAAAHQNLAVAMAEARGALVQEVIRPGADIDLDRGADQATAYRPENLLVRPCPGAATCGARSELSVSRALLGLFPNAYLLADQIGMGSIMLCYEAVRWVDREARPARGGDTEVARYFGRLSFELVGGFDSNAGTETVFRQRLTAADPEHYLFAAAEPALLERDCPHGLAGEAIASSLPEGRMGLVPSRLTYFVSTPVTADGLLTANWDRGAEWRDWFVTGGRVELLERSEPEAMNQAVAAQLASLASRRERQLAARLLSPLSGDSPDPLTMAMAEVSELNALLRRHLELHYPRLLRHHDPLRSLLTGESGLLSRDRVRQMRDGGIPMSQVPSMGRERLERFRELWLSYPTALRETGHLAPELDYGLEQLAALIALSRLPPAADAEPPAAP